MVENKSSYNYDKKIVFENYMELKNKARATHRYLKLKRIKSIEDYDPHQIEAEKHAEQILIDNEIDFNDWNTFKLKQKNANYKK